MHPIRQVLNQAGYEENSLRASLGLQGCLPGVRQRQRELPLYLHRTAGGTPRDTLIRLFHLHQSVPVDAAQRAVTPMAIEDWAQAGLLEVTPGHVQACVEFCVHQNLVAAADWPSGSGNAGEPVMGIAASSRTLADMMIRSRRGRTLDLGTGCGILALLAAEHSDEVVAVDCNPRAVELARLNAQLNGRANISFAVGDLLESVQGQTFDLIVCNPPFVIGPGNAPAHTQSGLRADDLCRRIVQEAPARLSEGGFCQLLCNWACIGGQDWQKRLHEWFQGTGCDAWVLHAHTEDAAQYAMKRVLEAEENGDVIARRFAEWQAYFGRERIEAVGFGLITMRRSGKRPSWFRCDRLPDVRGPFGADIEQGFALRDFLEEHREDRLFLQVSLQRSPRLHWELEQQATATNDMTKGVGGWTITRSRIRLADGLAYEGAVERDVIDFIFRCDSRRKLSEILNEITGHGRSVTPAMLNAIRHLVELGFLVPAR